MKLKSTARNRVDPKKFLSDLAPKILEKLFSLETSKKN